MNAKHCQSQTCRNAASRFIRTGATALLAVGAACTNSNELRVPVGSIKIEPASTTVSRGPIPEATGFVVPVTITNMSTQTVYYNGCAWRVEQSMLQGDEGPRSWESAFSPVCALELPPGSSPIPLEPGQSVTVTIDTRGSGLAASTVFAGQYRVWFRLLVEEFGKFYRLNDEQSVSTPFTVV
jgi:hypothetical protein